MIGFLMQRPIRTHRLSIAAIVSSAAFLVLAIAGIRSFWTWDQWIVGKGRAVGVDTGSFFYTQDNLGGVAPILSHQSEDVNPALIIDALPPRWEFMGFSVKNENSPMPPKGTFQVYVLRIPFWFPLLLLLVVPARWVLALPSDRPAFQAVTQRPNGA